MWRNSYKVDAPLAKTARIAEIELVPMDAVVEWVGKGLRDEVWISSLDSVCFRAVHREWSVR